MVSRRQHNRRAAIYSGQMIARPVPGVEETRAGRVRRGGRSSAQASRREALLLFIDVEGSITLDEARGVLAVTSNTMPSIELTNMTEEGLLVCSTMCGERTRVWFRPSSRV